MASENFSHPSAVLEICRGNCIWPRSWTYTVVFLRVLVLEPALFNAFVNGMDSGIGWIFSKIPYDTRLGSVVDITRVKGCWTCWTVSRRGHKADSVGWSTSPLRTELVLFSLDKRMLQGDFVTAFQCLKGANKIAAGRLFTTAGSARTRGNGFKLRGNSFRHDIRKKLFIMRVVRHRNRLLRAVVYAPLLEVFEAWLEGALVRLV